MIFTRPGKCRYGIPSHIPSHNSSPEFVCQEVSVCWRRYAGTPKTPESRTAADVIVVVITIASRAGVDVASRRQTGAHLFHAGSADATERRVRRVALPDQRSTSGDRATAGRQRTAGENLVPEPASQAEEVSPRRASRPEYIA